MSVVLRSQMLLAFLARAQRLGIETNDLVLRHHIAETDGAVRITCVALRNCAATIAERANDSRFGLHAALEMPRGAFGLVEYVVRNTPTLGALIEQLIRFSRLINAQLVARFDPATGRLEQRIANEPECLGKQGNEFSLAHQVKIVRDACAARVVVDRVYFAHAAPESPDDELADYFGTKDIVYACGFNGVDLPARALETPLISADPSLFRVLEARARELVGGDASDDALDNLRSVIAQELERGQPTAKRVAEILGASERTLHRRIAARGTSFGALVDRLRHQLAIGYLSDRARSISEIALLLGYSDGRAFARAFRRWTKTTPQEWREHQLKTQ